MADNDGHGVFALGGEVFVDESFVCRNRKDGLCVNSGTLLTVRNSVLKDNALGSFAADQRCFIEACDCIVDDDGDGGGQRDEAV